MLVSPHAELDRVRAGLPQLRQARLRRSPGLNFRMNEFTAALGIVQTERLDEIVAWKNARGAHGPRPGLPGARCSCPTGWSPGSTSTSSSTRSSARPARSTTSPATASSGAPVDLPTTRLGRRRTTGASPLYYRPRLTGQAATVRVLVTGGSGLHRLPRRRQAARRTGTSRGSSTCVARRHHRAPGEVDACMGDLARRRTCARRPAGCDAVLHLAAVADVDEVVARARRAPTSVNVRGTADAARGRARRRASARFVYASTIWVYGDASGAAPCVDEDTPLGLPDAPLHGDEARRRDVLPRPTASSTASGTTILRFGIPYGPRAAPAAVVAGLRRTRRWRGEPLTIAGDGTQSRRFVYVEDLAEGVVAALAPAGAGRIYNLVGDEDVSVREIADTVRELVGDVPIVHVEGRPGDLARGDLRRARGDRAGMAADDHLPRGRPALRRLALRRASATPPRASRLRRPPPSLLDAPELGEADQARAPPLLAAAASGEHLRGGRGQARRTTRPAPAGAASARSRAAPRAGRVVATSASPWRTKAALFGPQVAPAPAVGDRPAAPDVRLEDGQPRRSSAPGRRRRPSSRSCGR